MEKKLPKYFDQWQPLSAIQPRLNNRPNLQRHKNPPLFRRLLKSGFLNEFSCLLFIFYSIF